MGIARPGILLIAIIASVIAGSQVARGDSHTLSQMVVVVADRQGIRGSEGGPDLMKSFLGLVSALRDGQPFTFVYADEPTAFLGPAVTGEPDFGTLQDRFEANLWMPGSETEPDLVGVLAETFNYLAAEGATSGTTVYVVGGDALGANPARAAQQSAPVTRLYRERGWTIVGLSLPGTSQQTHDLLKSIASTSGGEALELSVPDGLKGVADQVLRDGARGSLAELGEDTLSPNAVFTATLPVAPGTSEATLLFFKDGPYASLRLTNPSGFEASEGDRKSSTVIETPHVVIWRLVDPAPGHWKVDVRGEEGVVSAWHYAANKYSVALQPSGAVPINERSSLMAYVSDGEQRVALEGVTVTARITAPNGGTLLHELSDEGVGADSVAGDGYFTGTIPPVTAEGEYQVQLELAWPQFDHSISSKASFQAQVFPSIEMTPIRTGDLLPGQRTRVATIGVHVRGQPYAVSTEAIRAGLTSNLDSAGRLEVEPQRLIEQDSAWEYDVFFTPEQEGLHTIVLQLFVEYAGRPYTYMSDAVVLSSAVPLRQTPPPPPAALQIQPQAAIPPPPLEPSGFPWGVVGGLMVLALAAVAAGVYWRTRPRPYGYLYDDRQDLVLDFSSLRRHPIMRLLFKNYVWGKELGVAGLEGVAFVFTGKRIGLRSRRASPTVRVNNQPIVGQTTINDRTWIGTHGRLYSFLLSPPPPRLEPEAGDD